MVGEEKRNSQILVYLPVTDVPLCTSRNAKTRGLKHLQLLDVASSSKPPHGTKELSVEQNTVPDGEATPPLPEKTSIPILPVAFFLARSM